jgi:hypothetical protein
MAKLRTISAALKCGWDERDVRKLYAAGWSLDTDNYWVRPVRAGERELISEHRRYWTYGFATQRRVYFFKVEPALRLDKESRQ